MIIAYPSACEVGTHNLAPYLKRCNAVRYRTGDVGSFCSRCCHRRAVAVRSRRHRRPHRGLGWNRDVASREFECC